ncbi:hypothetical protein G6F38_013400 [Rhizopus arrhizus]|nr:hypothetical protein G6F38_013400 [Rhizopus arrhizus]
MTQLTVGLYKNTNNRDLRKYLERQYYTKKAGISTGEEEDPVEEFIRKRKAAKVTRRSAKTRARKAIYEQYKDQGVYTLWFHTRLTLASGDAKCVQSGLGQDSEQANCKWTCCRSCFLQTKLLRPSTYVSDRYPAGSRCF